MAWWATSYRKATLLLFGLVLLAAGLLTVFDLRLASSQAITLTANQVIEPVPLDDPFAAVWNQASPVEIPLSAQEVTQPMGGGSARAVTARALVDEKRIYFLLEWEDATEDLSLASQEAFRDAAAIEFPSDGGQTLPSFCMGQTNAHVDIWQWKGDWQADIDRGFASVAETYPNAHVDLYPFRDDKTFYPGWAVGNPFSQRERVSPVESLVAGGFGTLTSADVQRVAGVGRWQDGRWRVLFVRELAVGDDDGVRFSLGGSTNVAFAVWDGSRGERDGQKSVSQFTDLRIGREAESGGISTGTWILIIALLSGLLAALVAASGWFILGRGRRSP
ncbi:MAG: ethylbenzene dehydrogenase-related protein [Chloroflexota bacterium]|nr:ethylbenzene dehydrogenase-related protein [Chloroflexota bacterium]